MAKLKSLSIVIALGILASVVQPCLAQQYLLEKGDLLRVSFWQQPELNSQARIDVEGKIDLPLIGRVTAAGLTVDQLNRTIVEKVSLYNKSITQASVTVEQYSSRTIFVTGAVAAPGKYPFVNPPNVWEAILSAGGPLATAQLDRVQLIRAAPGKSEIIKINLAAAFESGDLSNLPMVEAGDNIDVPAAVVPAAGQGAGKMPAGVAGRVDAIYVFGQVATPGVYPLDEGMDVLQAIIHAGGPVSVDETGVRRPSLVPDLRNVRVITKGPQSPVVYSVDLESYTKRATPLPLRLRSGDTIFVPAKQGYARFFLTSTLLDVLRTSAAIVTTYLLVNKVLQTN